MKKDFQNILLTFGLIALVFTGGSLAYQDKVEGQYVSAASQETVVIPKKISSITTQKQTPVVTTPVAQTTTTKQQVTQEQLAIQNAKNQQALDSAIAAQAQADLARQQAQAQAQVVVRPSRQARAS
jgi:hypothetical protein